MSNSILQLNKDKCFMCGHSGNLHKHHILNGPYRTKCDEDGLYIYVHDIPCHREIHDAPKQYIYLKQYAQEKYEKTHTRKEFIKRYGKSYL